MKEKLVFAGSRRFPCRAYLYLAEGKEPRIYLEVDGESFVVKDGWPPPDDVGPHEIIRVLEWDQEAPEETYREAWRESWGSCD